jgi:hypothetical protein
VPWFKVDDSLAFHAKTVAAGNAAMGLWVRAGAWCSHTLTDGFVPDHMAAALGKASEAKQLVTVGLWTKEEGGFRFWQWGERNPLRTSVEEERSAARERMRLAREAKRSGEQPPSVQANVQANSARSSGSVAVTRPDPTRPDPNRTTPAAAAAASLSLDAETEGQRVNRIARTYTDRTPLSNFTAIAGVIRKAVRAGPYSDTQLTDALARLADDNRSVTADSLRIELEGRPLRAVTGRPSPRTFTDEDYSSGF